MLRFWLLTSALAAECLAASLTLHPWVDARAAADLVVLFSAALLFFARERLTAAMPWAAVPVQAVWLALHACALISFAASNEFLLHAVADSVLRRCALVLWYAALLALPVTLTCAIFDPRRLLRLLGNLGEAWGLAAAVSVTAMLVRDLVMLTWDAPSSRAGHAMQAGAVRGVAALLGCFFGDVQADSAQAIVGTREFAVEISARCSGMEGLALTLSLTVGWLIFSRRKLRIGRALLLVPLSLAVMWAMNLVRIAALIAIGSAGYEATAAGGFHSQAGWIVFNAVALGFLLVVHRVQWFQRPGEADPSGNESDSGFATTALGGTNTAAVYLVPFLAMLAAGAVAAALSSGFERLYGLRVVAAGLALYTYRREYARMDWRFGWIGPAAGVAVFAMWLGLQRWLGAGLAGEVLPAGLAQLSAGQRVVWIGMRVLCAVVAAPLAEELAFRGYLARRLVSADVEQVSLRALSAAAVLASSVLFGALQGRMWVAGMLAGIVFAAVARRRGRLGEAVAAHATANLLLAMWVLARGDYGLW